MNRYVFDLDDVLADTLTAVIGWHNRVYGTSLTREDFKSYRFWEAWSGTREEAIKKMDRFADTEDFQGIQRYPGADLVFSLQGSLYVATSRPTYSRGLTEAQVESLFPNVFSDVCFSGEFFGNGQETKSQICDRVNAGVLVEDQMAYALACRSSGRKVLLLDSPWNQEKEPDQVIRVSGWRGEKGIEAHL